MNNQGGNDNDKKDNTHRRRKMQRLRRLRGGLPERLGDAVHGREDYAPRHASVGPAGARGARGEHAEPARLRGIRRVPEHRRVRGGVPQADPARCHLATERRSVALLAARALRPFHRRWGPGPEGPGPHVLPEQFHGIRGLGGR